MTRPHMEREDKRTSIFKVRLTAREKQILLELAANAGLSPSDFVRVQTVGSKPERRKATETLQSIRTLTAHIAKELGHGD